MTLSRADFEASVEEANRAPSVHNVQPARWRLTGEGTLLLKCDHGVALPVADASGHDLMFSCGTVLEGMVMALAKRGYEARVTLSASPSPDAALAELHLSPVPARPDPLDPMIPRRFTCRSGFAPASPVQLEALDTWAAAAPDLHVIRDAASMAELFAENDRLSLETFRNAPFRAELRKWMRLTPSHPRWLTDGLNARALGMNRLEAILTPLFLSTPAFRLFDTLGIARHLVAETAGTTGTSAILCLSVPSEQSAVTAGRRYYRATLELTELGFSSWPMSVLVDTPSAQDDLKARFGLGETRRLVSCLRIGPAAHTPPAPSRRPVSDLVW